VCTRIVCAALRLTARRKMTRTPVFVLLLLVAALLPGIAKASDDLAALDSDLSLLEAEADVYAPEGSASGVLAAAQAYAEKKVNKAVEAGKALLAQAAEEGRKEAEQLGPAPAKPKSLTLEKQQAEIKRLAKLEAAKIAQKQAIAKAKAAVAKAKAAAKRALAPFKGQKLKPDSQGVYGGVNFGLPKADTLPSGAATKKDSGRTAFNRFDKYGPKKNIYGRKKSCLKDIAAHFDEKDIYESKKLALIQQMQHVKSRVHATQIRSRLANLETWHQMMQKKFLMSAKQLKRHKARMERLMDVHLPQDLKDQLKANKVAKRAGQKLPFPLAHAKAMKIMRQKRKQIERQDALHARGFKRMLRPEINDKGFPSMDPISTVLREQIWRPVKTGKRWSTDKGVMELADNVVKAASKDHEDFVYGPIAGPILKGKLYTPETEKLGVPNFLRYFPWPKTPAKTVTMDDKVRVQQSYYQTW